MSIASLQQLGSVLLSPVFTFMNQKLIDNIPPQEPIFFLAREGYWFSRSYSEFCRVSELTDNGRYMLVSRAFLFKIGLLDPKTLPYSLDFNFTGTLYELIRSRFMLSDMSINSLFPENVQKQVVSLPQDLHKVSALLVKNLDKLLPIIKPSMDAYTQYLASIGFFDNDAANIVDLGYSGTIQTLLSILFKKNTVGHYLIASNPGEQRIASQKMIMKGYLKEGVKMGGGYIPLDRSMFLEALLTAPVGQFQDIRLNILPNKLFDIYYGRKVLSQHQFHLLEQICSGAISQMSRHTADDVIFSPQEIEDIYIQFVTKKSMLPKTSWPLFSIDDDTAGEGTVNGLDFFGLKQ